MRTWVKGDAYCLRWKTEYRLKAIAINVLVNKILAAKKFVSPERLPPTESATITVCALIYGL